MVGIALAKAGLYPPYVLALELADVDEVSRLQTGQVMDKLLGLEVK